MEDSGLGIRLDHTNVYCVDNEAFRYLAAVRAGVAFPREEEEVFSASWERSKRELERLVGHAAGLRPAAVPEGAREGAGASAAMVAKARRLVRPLVDVAGMIQVDLEELREERSDAGDTPVKRGPPAAAADADGIRCWGQDDVDADAAPAAAAAGVGRTRGETRGEAVRRMEAETRLKRRLRQLKDVQRRVLAGLAATGAFLLGSQVEEEGGKGPAARGRKDPIAAYFNQLIRGNTSKSPLAREDWVGSGLCTFKLLAKKSYLTN